MKATEFFRAGDGRFLRVSRYFRTDEQEPQLRVSIWDEGGSARAVAALDEGEAERLGAFLADTAQPAERRSPLRLRQRS